MLKLELVDEVGDTAKVFLRTEAGEKTFVIIGEEIHYPHFFGISSLPEDHAAVRVPLELLYVGGLRKWPLVKEEKETTHCCVLGTASLYFNHRTKDWIVVGRRMTPDPEMRPGLLNLVISVPFGLLRELVGE